MSTVAVMTTGLLMPSDFPIGGYQAVHLKIAPHATNNKPVYDQFAGAWNAITYRYKAFAEYDDLFSNQFRSTVQDRLPRSDIAKSAISLVFSVMAFQHLKHFSMVLLLQVPFFNPSTFQLQLHLTSGK